MSSRSGFTLIEALLAVVTLALLASGLAVLYASGHHSLGEQAKEVVFCSALRSEMERTMAMPFDQLVDSSTVLTLRGQTHTSLVSVAFVDMDGDGMDDTNAVRVTVSISDRSLTALRADGEGRLRKL